MNYVLTVQFQIIVTKKRSASNGEGPSTVNEHPVHKFQCGDFVAVYLDKYKDEVPQIGKVLREDSSNTIEVEWWTGSYSGKYKCNYVAIYINTIIISKP